jgi:hypothetical protein
MSNSFNRETLEAMWKGVANDYERWDILFQVSLNTNERVEKLEKRKRFDTTVSTVSGFMGGVSAMVGKWVFWK